MAHLGEILPRYLTGSRVEILTGEDPDGRIRVKLLEGRGIWPEGMEVIVPAGRVIREPGDPDFPPSEVRVTKSPGAIVDRTYD